MPDRYYVLENSEFYLVYNATDPEGYPMTYDFTTKYISSISPPNENRKLLKLNETRNISLLVTDYGDLKAVHTVEIVTIPCSCQNGGR